MTSLTPMQEPHILSNEAMRWIAEKSAESVFSVRVWLRSKADKERRDADTALQNLMEKVGTEHRHLPGAAITEAEKSLEAKQTQGFSEVTGFCIGKTEGCLTILTVSHVIQEIYGGDTHISAGSSDHTNMDILQDINTAFYFEVLCVHQERLLRDSGVEDISKLERYYARADVVALDTRVDLLALSCPLDQICLSGVNVFCPNHDRSLAIADLPPPKSEVVLLQGWPNLLSDFQRWGNISVNDRPYNVVAITKEYGYQMKLFEIPGMKCVSECSGGPVVVGATEEGRFTYVGVFFRTIKNSGYAVSLGDIKVFLAQFGLLDDADDAPAAYEHVPENNHGDHSEGGEEGKRTTE